METNNQYFFGSVAKFDEVQKTVKCNIMHFDTPNENLWSPVTGCLDDYFVKMAKAKKYVPAFLNHDLDGLGIGLWKELEVVGNVLVGTLYLSDIPLVRETVIPQLKEGTLQGASPTILTIEESYDRENNIWNIIKGFLIEASLVYLPADFKADVLQVQASVSAKQKENFDFELLTL